MSEFRCSTASRDDSEPMPGTAPTDLNWLFVEYAGAWGRQAVAESRLPESVRSYLDGLSDTRVQLIRRTGRASSLGVRIYAARLAEGLVGTAVLENVEDVIDLDPGILQAHDEPLWLVCTNGRRDLCCAEIGRPIAAALASHWPEETWETTHLGGHRFSGTLLALPSGITLGRLDAATAVEACKAIEAGEHPLEWSRGRAGFPPAAQVAELALRADGHHEVHWQSPVDGTDGGWIATMTTPDRTWKVTVAETPGEARRQSCADLKMKPSPVLTVKEIA